MKITIRLLTVIFLSVITFRALAQSDADRSMLRNEIEKDLTENILSFRMEMPDHPKGGVLNAYSGHWKITFPKEQTWKRT